MKYVAVAFILTLSSALIAQNPTNMSSFTNQTYDAEWKRIDSLEQQGLPQSALSEVEKLYARAKSANNPAQIVKTLIYQQKYQSQLEEDGDVQSILRLQKELAAAEFPVQPILQSILAELYNRYWQQNRWQIQERTTTDDFIPEDIRTWSAEQFLSESARLYLASLADPRTRQTPLADFKDITLKAENSEGLWPTLYDLLAHRAIQYFSNETSYLNQPVYRFVLNQAEAFADAATFVNTTFATKDTAALKYRALLLFQQVLQHHLNDADPKALIDADLKRLQFVHNASILPNKDDLYLKALEALRARYRQHPSAAEVAYQIASHHYQKGSEYNWNDPATEPYRLRYQTAMALCEAAVKTYPRTFGANQCAALQSQILQKSLSLQAEEVNLPNQAIPVQVEYRNMQEVFLRVAQLSEQDASKIEGLNYEETLNVLLKLKKIKEWSVKLPDDGDFQLHTTEVALDGLPFGQYVILASDNKKFQSKGGAAGYLFTQVSNLAYFQRQMEGGAFEFVIVHRNTGEPLAGVEAEFFGTDYSNRRNQATRRSLGKMRSDAQGFVRLNLQSDLSISVELTQGKDKLYAKRSFYNFFYRGQQERSATTHTHFFLDRKIYRPGQTIYFKALVFEKDVNEMPRILPNHDVTITFYDVNYQEVGALELRTNEFGTVNGSFTAPRSGLLGQMHLDADTDEGEIYFNVEEYKRPKFEVVMQPLEKGYALGDTAQVRGVAKAYAGSNVDGATVRYRVTREVQYPWMPWWLWRRGGFPMRGETTEIGYGETTTDANGEFVVNFAALPDPTVEQTRNPMFIFKVAADVIDITGETHTCEKVLNLGYLTLQADFNLPERIDRSTPLDLKISTTNLDGQPAPAQGAVTIHRLQPPQRTFIQRYWGRPDRPTLSKDQFYKLFPHFAYADEDEPQNWDKVAEIYTTNFNTQTADNLLLNLQNQEVGHYAITLATQDGNGKPITVTKFFTLYDASARLIPAHTLHWNQLNKDRFEPGEQMQLQFASSTAPLHILYEQSNRTSHQNARWLRVNNWQSVDYEVSEADRGNLSYTWNAVRFNRVFNGQQFVQVPWSNKDLRIEYSTFRDKLRPGQEEEWRITISGAQRERVAAEIVAAMYDASLDALAPTNSWAKSFYPAFNYNRRENWNPQLFGINNLNLYIYTYDWQRTVSVLSRTYPVLNWFGYYGGGFYGRDMMVQMRAAPGIAMPAPEMPSMALSETVVAGYSSKKEMDASLPAELLSDEPVPPQPVRTNLKETVFFLPDLQTDADGNVIIKFTMNEALTRWKFLTFAHTQDLQFAATEREIVTQKELMVLPNPPRFMREGDELYFTAKVSNLSEQTLAGKIRLELFDAATMQPVASKLGLQQTELNFLAAAGQSDGTSWRLRIPTGELTALTWRVTAQAGNFSDGEESSLPILTNRMLVTETLPMALRSGQTKEFTLQNLRNNTSKTLDHHALTLEFTPNPAWYAVQALPYLMEYPYDCVEQIFNRYYANALAASVANATPKIRQVFERWKGTDALESNLTKNQELKSALLAETPWVLDAQNEAQQRKNIGVLFDLMRLSEEQTATLNKLAERQLPDGGFAWFPGGRANWYITQYIVEGFGHLDKLGAGKLQDNPTAYQIIGKSIQFIDNELANAYADLEKLVKEGKAKWEDDHLSNIAIHYLYARSFFRQFPVENAVAKKAADYYLGQAEKYWLNKGFYQEGLLALALHRYNKPAAAEKIVKSLRERALRNEELGMYWKHNAGYFWHQMPIESQALMIEVFAEVAKDNASVDEMRIWLLKNKQTNSWETTKATAAAVYALLMNGSEWLSDTQAVDIAFPNLKKRDQRVTISASQQSAEPGTGYFKTAWEGSEINASMATVKVSNPNKTVAWGSLYWQYFEDLDKIKTFRETPLNLVKQVFRAENTDRGPVLKNITAKDPLRPGDKLIVRIELRVDRDMEFVHLKDMRASGLEPLNVLSGYRWQGGLGYYESTRDVATDFFIDYLPKGTYVFEYPLRVIHEGDFSNGITSIQCMYAPEFASHSEGIRLKVE
jgi:uncharacterized protein YfaS (alpha-2-macroglobulin family)